MMLVSEYLKVTVYCLFFKKMCRSVRRDLDSATDRSVITGAGGGGGSLALLSVLDVKSLPKGSVYSDPRKGCDSAWTSKSPLS